MAFTLSNLIATPRRRPKRLGRGNASGRGTTAGRGTKGQRARSGGRNGLKAKALKSLFQRLPKHGGFKSLRPKAIPVSLQDVAKHFPAGSTVTPETLRSKNLIGHGRPVKILSTGTIAHAVTIRGCKVSEEAAKKITAAGGTIAA